MSMRDKLLSEVENSLKRALFNIHSVSSKSLQNTYSPWLLSLKSISKKLPYKLSLMFYGWSSGTVHFVVLFATFLDNSIYREVLLGCALLLQDENLSTNQYLEYINNMLKFYKKSIFNLVCLIRDNWSTNRRLSDISVITLTGCFFHKSHLSL